VDSSAASGNEFFKSPDVFVQSLKLYNFRNLDNTEITFSSGINLILGPNGQGKTNLIEAVSALSSARSFRTSDIRELVRWGEQEGSVFGQIRIKEGDFKLGIIFRDGKREAYINDQRSKGLVEMIGRFTCITFSPADLELVKGSPTERRKLVDRLGADLDPSIASSLINYQRALNNKNALLKSYERDKTGLSAWNDVLAGPGATIVNNRRKLAAQLSMVASKYYESFAPTDELLTIESIDPWPTTTDLTAGVFREQLELVAARELAAGTTVLGPHRDDFLVSLSGRDARSFASQGQARSIVLALKLATLEILESALGESPVVILDDVDSELDLSRRAAFFSMIFSTQRQIFITATEQSEPMRDATISPLIVGVREGRLKVEGVPSSSELRSILESEKLA
jgi:DNA replication and repair protein RecF